MRHWVYAAYPDATTLVRYAVVRAGAFAEKDDPVYGLFKSMVDSFIYAMQSFTMDADYTGFLVDGSKALRESLKMPAMAGFFEIYISILNPICAISGGAVLLTIIIKLFPNIKHWFARAFSQRPLYYFSKLNPESLALAESIYNKYNKQGGDQASENTERPRLIFCDADVDDDSISDENREKAKRLRSVLVKTSLSELEFDGREKKKFFLIGTDEDNLAALSSFTAKGRMDKLNEKNTIYVFANENYGTLIERSIREKINQSMKDKDKNSKGITLFSVNRHRNIVYDLLQKVPLYYSMQKNGLIRVAIFGSGRIGVELFLAVYWCGQMLGRKLKITVISDERRDLFEGRINHINHEILKTAEPDCKLLQVKQDGSPKAPEYFSYEYIESDVYADGLEAILIEPNRENGKLADFDYFAIALGTDKKNLEAAEQIARIVTVKGVRREKPVPVVCSIWDEELSKTLTDINGEGYFGAMVRPFGSLDETFAEENVLIESIKEHAKDSSSAYEQNIAEKRSKAQESKYAKDPYSYWANVSRAIHLGYKAQALDMPNGTDGNDAAKVCYIAMYRFLSSISSIKNTLLYPGSYTNAALDNITLNSLNDECGRRVVLELNRVKPYIEDMQNRMKQRKQDENQKPEAAEANDNNIINEADTAIGIQAGKLKLTVEDYAYRMIEAIKSFCEDQKALSHGIASEDGSKAEIRTLELLCTNTLVSSILTNFRSYEDFALKEFKPDRIEGSIIEPDTVRGGIEKKLADADKHLETWEGYYPAKEFEAGSPGNYIQECKNYLNETIKAFLAGEKTIDDVISSSEPACPELFHRLAWLEHRRWTAFMRTEGFTCPEIAEETSYIAQLCDDTLNTGCNLGKHKNIELKLHPCIVECDDQGMKADLFASKMYNDDMLDGVSRRFKKEYVEKNFRTYDFKMYEYPEYE
ncbi:MAG: hypothetical protein IKZ82_03405 [Clostridia bacterium]|nr:hypothetical protein [Clostridia bacterium]